MSEEIALLVFGVILFVVVIAIYRDSQLSGRIRSLESVIESLHREIFKVSAELRDEIYKVADEIRQKEGHKDQEIQKKIDDLVIEFDMGQVKVARLEDKINEFLTLPNVGGFDASRAISLHNMGYTVEDISKELRVSVNEISLALKLNNLEPRRMF